VSDNHTLHSPIGLVAGNGSFPLEFLKNAKARGLDVVVVAHVGETDRQVEGLAWHCAWIRVGQVGKLLRTFKRKGVRQAAFVGGIRRARLFGSFRPDLRALSIIARLGSVKDDKLLRAVAAEIEKDGIEVFSASVLLERSVPCVGTLTRRALSEAERSGAAVGWEASKGVGALDIGQTVVVCQGVVVAVEAVEGTDAAIARGGDLAGRRSGRPEKGSLVVVKLAKPQQDLRLDLPAVGVGTISAMKIAGASALVLEAGKAVILNPQEVIEAADMEGIAIEAVNSREDLGGNRKAST
jgi:UDP-2,3-diacylglucosamine hydrolase